MNPTQNTLQELPKIQEIKAVGVPFKCPVCNGFGSVNWGKQTCVGCEGKGYVVVPAKPPERGRYQ